MARFSINDQAQPGTYSAEMTNSDFLLLHSSPGIVCHFRTVNLNHALKPVNLRNRELQFDVSGIAFKLVSSRTMLGKTGRPLWLNYDPRFTWM